MIGEHHCGVYKVKKLEEGRKRNFSGFQSTLGLNKEDWEAYIEISSILNLPFSENNFEASISLNEFGEETTTIIWNEFPYNGTFLSDLVVEENSLSVLSKNEEGVEHLALCTGENVKELFALFDGEEGVKSSTRPTGNEVDDALFTGQETAEPIYLSTSLDRVELLSQPAVERAQPLVQLSGEVRADCQVRAEPLAPIALQEADSVILLTGDEGLVSVALHTESEEELPVVLTTENVLDR